MCLVANICSYYKMCVLEGIWSCIWFVLCTPLPIISYPSSSSFSLESSSFPSFSSSHFFFLLLFLLQNIFLLDAETLSIVTSFQMTMIDSAHQIPPAQLDVPRPECDRCVQVWDEGSHRDQTPGHSQHFTGHTGCTGSGGLWLWLTGLPGMFNPMHLSTDPSREAARL